MPSAQSGVGGIWTFDLRNVTRGSRRFHLDGTSALDPAQPFGDAPSAAPPSAERWRTQQTLTYRAGAGIELQAGVSAAHGTEWPFSLQQLDAPRTSPLGGFGVEPRSLGTVWHTSFGLRKLVYDDGERTLSLFGEAIDIIPIDRQEKDPVAKASRSPRVRVGGIFGF